MKKILIAARELDCGGTEIAMLNFLKNLENNKFDITLLLSRKRGVYIDKVPQYIKIIEIPFINEVYRYYISNDTKIVTSKIERFFIKCIRKLMRGLNKILKTINYRCDLYNIFLLRKTQALDMEYDLAIDFFGYGEFQAAYIAKNVRAKNKLMWIHDERLIPIKRVRNYFKEYNYFFGVSKACAENFKKEFPETRGRVGVFGNIIDMDNIMLKAQENIEYKQFDSNKFNIITVGRLEWQKGYDLAIKVAKELDMQNVNFRWYIIGEGSEKKKIQRNIKALGLLDKVVLLGRKDNPYPYILKSNLYVQTSRHEGYGLAIAEARILNKAIVSTDLPCVREQINDGVTGYLLEYNVDEFSKLIYKLYKNRNLITIVENNLKKYDQSSKNEINKLDSFL